MNLCSNKSLDQSIIRQEIINMLSAKFEIPPVEFHAKSDECSEEMTIPLTPCEMVYLVHFLEDKFCFRFTETNFDEPCIYTINGLSSIIEQCINQKAWT